MLSQELNEKMQQNMIAEQSQRIQLLERENRLLRAYLKKMYQELTDKQNEMKSFLNV